MAGVLTRHCRRVCQLSKETIYKRGWSTQKEAAPQVSRSLKYGLITTGVLATGGSVYYMTLDDIEKRRLRVSVGGIRRFFRYCKLFNIPNKAHI